MLSLSGYGAGRSLSDSLNLDEVFWVSLGPWVKFLGSFLDLFFVLFSFLFFTSGASDVQCYSSFSLMHPCKHCSC